MRRSNSNMNSLSTIMRKILKNPKLSKRLDNIKIIEIWNELIGSNLEKYVLDSKVYKGKLYIKLKSSTLRNEFTYKKSELLKQINNRFGKQVIDDIVFK
tara:strand:+ start:2175 stop:2471 length:297 start_codon:yes stop_codon:yes gene_type:complete